MRAAVLHQLRSPLSLEEVPTPTAGPGELLIQVIACGVCHSDVHAIDGDWDPAPALPLIPGHEVTGRVAAIGGGVDGFAVGDLVGVPWMWSSCGRCELCLNGMETICRSAEATGYTQPGGFAEHLVAPAAYVGRVPDGCDPYALAPILCAGVTTYRGLKRTGARPGQWVAVIGIGGLGHIAVQYARAMGLRVVAVDVDEEKLALAASLGAELTVNGRFVDPPTAVHEAIGGVHAALVTATSPTAFEQAPGLLRPGGTVCFIGLPGGDADSIRASISAIVNNELSVRGSNVGTRADLAEAIAFAANGLVAATITTVGLDDVNQAIDDLRSGRTVGRTVLRIS